MSTAPFTSPAEAPKPKAGRTGNPIPAEIRDTLARMLRRARLLTLARGAAVSVAAFIAVALAVMAVDLVLPIWDWHLRLALTLFAVITSVVILIRQVIIPILRPISWAGLARQIDTADAGLQERLSSAVEFLVSQDPEELRGSRQLIRRVVGEATRAAPQVELKKVIKAERAKKFWIVTGSLLGLVALAAAIWPDFRTLAVRFAMPTSSIARVSLTRVSVEPQPKDGRAAVLAVAGEPLQIKAHVTGRAARSATLYLDWGNRQEEMMMAVSPEDPNVFIVTLSAVPGHGSFEARANDGNSGQVAIQAVSRPRVEAVQVKLTPPEYTGEKPRTVTLSGEPVDVLYGTRVEMLVQCNKGVEKAKVQFADNQVMNLFEKSAEGAASSGVKPGQPKTTDYGLSFTPKISTSFKVLLQDQYGFENPPAATETILVRPDAPPTVQIIAPKSQVTLRPKDKLPIQFAARDDLGLDRLELIYRLDESAAQARPALASNQIAGKTAVSGAAVLDLAALKAGQAKVVHYRLRAYDRRPASLGGPGTGDSAEQMILIDNSATPFTIQMLGSLRERIRKAIAAIDADLKKADETVEPALAKADKHALTEQESSSGSGKLLASDKGLRDLADLVANTEYVNFGDRAKEIAEQPVALAMKKLTEAGLAVADGNLRKQNLTECDFHIHRARAQLAELAKQLDDLLAYEKAALQAQETAQRQTDLMKQLAEMEQEAAKGQKPSEQQWSELSKEQKELIEQTQQILSEHPELGMQPLATQAKKQEKALQEQVDDLIKSQNKLTQQSAQEAARDEKAKKLEELKQKDDAPSKADAQKMDQEVAKENSQAIKDQLARLADDQNKVASEAGEINDKLGQLTGKNKPNQPAEQTAVAPAAAAAAQAVPKIAASNLREAAQEMEKAAKGLQDFAQQTPQKTAPAAMTDAREAGNEATTEAELHDQAAKLATKEAALAEEAKALAEGKTHDAMATQQGELAQEAKAVGQQVETLTTTLAPLGDEVVKAAKEAADTLEKKVPQEMQSAKAQIAAQKSDKAAEPQKKAEAMLQEARQSLDKLALQVAQAQMQDTSPAAMNPEEAAQASQELTQALQDQLEALQMAQAAAQGQPDPSQQNQPGQQTPEQTMAQAAQMLNMASESLAQMMANMPSPSEKAHESQSADNSTDSKKGKSGKGEAAKGALKGADPRLAGKRQWNLIFESVNGEVQQGQADRTPLEYRELVKQYFDRIGQEETAAK